MERFGVTQALEEILSVRGATQRPWHASLARWLAEREKKKRNHEPENKEERLVCRQIASWVIERFGVRNACQVKKSYSSGWRKKRSLSHSTRPGGNLASRGYFRIRKL
jgi:hypothetical protein